MNSQYYYRAWLAIAVALVVSSSSFAADGAASKTDARYPFRTDFANDNLPWYMPKPDEFPPYHSDRRIGGELVTADFIHRTGQFRTTKNGELIDFTMPPYGSINYLNAEADLRDVPLGTFFLFFLNQDSQGHFTRLATMQDQFTMDASHGFDYRLDEIKLGEGKLLTTKQNPGKKQSDHGKKELIVTDQTRIWKGDKQIKLADLAVGDELLFNLTGRTATDPGRCTEIWVGVDTHKLATEQQHKKFTEFLKARGLPGWIDSDQGNQLTVTLFTGDPGTFKQTWLSDFVVGREIKVVVANDQLRTWNPPVDNERGKLLAVNKTGVGAYGTSGVQMVFTVNYMLEGFRKGRVVRVFGTGWTLKDPPYGEGLMNYGYGGLRDPELIELPPKEYPEQFPFRTDWGNDQLPWYQLKAGEIPPRYSDHLICGEMLKVDPATHSGQFRTDRTGELVNFSLVPQGSSLAANTNRRGNVGPAYSKDVSTSIRCLNADASLSDLPLGARYRFHLYQDDKGAFTRASLIEDEFSYLSLTAGTYRIQAIKLDDGKLCVARQLPQVKNYNGDMVQPPDIARTELLVNANTRVWKGAQQVKLADLAVGDLLLVNLTGEQTGSPSHCTDIWDGVDAQQHATDEQQSKHPARKKK